MKVIEMQAKLYNVDSFDYYFPENEKLEEETLGDWAARPSGTRKRRSSGNGYLFSLL